MFKNIGPQDYDDLCGPGFVDGQLRQTVRACWMMMPQQRRSIDEVEREVRRLLDRIFRDMREDEQISKGGPDEEV